MRHALHFFIVSLLILVTGCGGENNDQNQPKVVESPEEEGASEEGSFSVDREFFLDELSPQDWTEICTWMIEIQGGPHSVECGEGVTITIDTVDECSNRSEFPHCAVGLLADCVTAQAEDLCGDAPAACDTFYACVYAES